MIVNSFKESPVHAPLVLSNSYNTGCADSGNTGFPFDLFNEKSEFYFLISSMFYIPGCHHPGSIFQVPISSMFCVPGSHHPCSMFHVPILSRFYVPDSHLIHVLCSRLPSHPCSIFQVPISFMICVSGSHPIHVLYFRLSGTDLLEVENWLLVSRGYNLVSSWCLLYLRAS